MLRPNVGAPQVAYRETFRKAVDVEGKFVRQSGGRGQYGHCKVKFTPIRTDAEHNYEFINSVVGGAILKNAFQLSTRYSGNYAERYSWRLPSSWC